MAIDFEKEAEKYREDLKKDLITLLKIDSSRDLAHKSADAPLGPGPKAALLQALDFAKRDGFQTKNVENVAGRVEYGDGDEILGVFAHMDEVPAGDGWDTNPFEPVIKDGKIYARGSSDDKGPAMAAYYGLKILKDNGVKLNKKIHFIYGTDEENDWYGLNQYLKSEPTPDFGFSPDASFPIINGEKGITNLLFNFVAPNDGGDFTLLEFKAGTASNMVPQTAKAAITYNGDDLPEDFLGSFNRFLADNKIKGTMVRDDNNIEIQVVGKGTHAMDPKLGKNAATYLAAFLDQYDFDEQGQNYLDVIATYMHNNFDGSGLGIDHHDDLMGDLTASPDVFDYTQNGKQTLVLNIRYPQGTDPDKMIKQMHEHMNFPADLEITVMGEPEAPHYVPGTDPLVKTLLDTWTDHTGQPGHEEIIGGGTYGRLIKRGVGYGALFPNRENVMHQANEYMYIDDILKACAIYADAMYRLAK
ncbi:dipeptidase PepV [Lactobacillus selangorensis]|uniref:Dipeptidase PepV n=1 Tax=Lactobacillus selangorensis TaxID=81857 RepID=A0A0R2FQ53_9LACO|nr:dipeptidase PepV [Lactobacillus selangorensis]KRN27479.1 dipeptidase PepV [Lactobacillus selangorensis]KRN31324.1 dipeptidase PepV [Lactobacillus selangorensis]